MYTSNIYKACDTVIHVMLFSLKIALGQKFGKTKTDIAVERLSV